MKKIILISIVLLLTSCTSILNPFNRTDTVENFKTRQDTATLVNTGKKTIGVIDTIDTERSYFNQAVDENLPSVINHPDTKIAGETIKIAKERFDITVDEGLATIRQAQQYQIEKAEDIKDRSQPEWEVKGIWKIGIILLIIFAIGGVPALIVIWKVFRSITSTLGGLAVATVESMEKNENISNSRIPKSLQKFKEKL